MTGILADARERERICTDTAETLFVNAGAGSGKTAALIDRVTTLVLRDGVRLSHIVAVTFTEKAGAELRDRLREKFEAVWRAGGPDKPTAEQALDDLDGAAIGTLHAFGQRLLTEHPIEAGLPPIVEVLDEVGSSVAFDERWSELQAELLDDDDIAAPLLLGMAMGMTLEHVRSLAVLLGKDWDLIEDRVLAAPPLPVEVPDVTDLLARARELVQCGEHCTAPDDRLLRRLTELGELVELIDTAPDDGTVLTNLERISKLPYRNTGQKGNWRVPIQQVREVGLEIGAEARGMLRPLLDRCLRQVTSWVGQRVLDAAETRRREGKLEFHDLLVLPRDLLRRDAGVRAAVHEDYQRLLLDEFQDTDPIQIELAARICGGAGADDARWQAVDVPPGRLFVVGDSKQSIYRFRRADIATYLEAEKVIGDTASLTTNFRTVDPILQWVNAVFARLIQPEPGGQPAYVPLDCSRDDAGNTGPAVTVLGATAHTDLPSAAAELLRQREADDVAAVIRQALGERWQVYDKGEDQWRDARPDDIAVLVPARTSLPYLENALDAAHVPYRAEASSLVYQAAEVRSLLACARAVADTSDSLALVTALRSPLFGCGDDDLWRWKHAGGRFTIFWTLDDANPLAAGPVGAALAELKKLHRAARWLSPSEVLGKIIADRRMFEVAATGPRERDSWRRLRFVVDQARAWSEVSHGGLRAYLAWAAHQGQEVSRVAEAILPETDSNSVRVMTIHAAKGLEFPIVILSGMTAQKRNATGVSVLWPPEGGHAVKLTKAVQTGDFETAVPIDEQMDDLEKLRLLYVAATRARDHLVVSVHRQDGSSKVTAASLIAGADGVAAAGATAFEGYRFDRSAAPEASSASAPPPFEDWLAGVREARERSAAEPAENASGLEGTEPDLVLDSAVDDGLAKGARDLELPPWSKGRYGSAIGRAVHAVLQAVDLASGEGLAGAVAAQAIAEGVVGQETVVTQLVEAALSSDVVQRAAAREHWRETYVGTLRDDGKVLEGYVDLIYRDDDESLVVVDYKTDAVPTAAIGSRVTYYKPQMDAYCDALAAATGSPVSATLLFLNPTTSMAVDVPRARPS